MNLTDYRVTSPLDAFEAVRTRAAAAGVHVRESEVVGLLPLDAVARLASTTLRAPALLAIRCSRRASSTRPHSAMPRDRLRPRG